MQHPREDDVPHGSLCLPYEDDNEAQLVELSDWVREAHPDLTPSARERLTELYYRDWWITGSQYVYRFERYVAPFVDIGGEG